MSDIAAELAKLHVLKGADYSRAELCFPEGFRQEVPKGIREIKDGGRCQSPSFNFGAGAV